MSNKNTHILKTDPELFKDISDGKKTFELRKNDSDFKVGDLVILKETEFSFSDMIALNKPLKFTGSEITTEITYLLGGISYGLQDGYICFSFKILDQSLG